MLVAPGRMIDDFLPIPEAKSLRLHSIISNLICVCIIGSIINQYFSFMGILIFYNTYIVFSVNDGLMIRKNMN